MKEEEWDRRLEDAKVRKEMVATLSSVKTALEIYKESQEELKSLIEEHDDILRGTDEKAGFEERFRSLESKVNMLLVSVEGYGGNRDKSVFGEIDSIKKNTREFEKSINAALLGINFQLDAKKEAGKAKIEMRAQNFNLILGLAAMLGGIFGTAATMFGPKIVEKMFNPDPIVVPKGTPTPVPKFLKKKKKAPPPVKEETPIDFSDGEGDSLDQAHTEGKKVQ